LCVAEKSDTSDLATYRHGTPRDSQRLQTSAAGNARRPSSSNIRSSPETSNANTYPRVQELGISITPWSPIGSGFLSGKFRRVAGKITGAGQVADGLGKSPAEVAFAWVIGRPCVTSTLIGATRVEQLEKNLASQVTSLPEDAIRVLDEASAPEPNELDRFFDNVMQAMVNGGTDVARTVY
jgi:diketogulonate reductase-like aldo/keto reductase